MSNVCDLPFTLSTVVLILSSLLVAQAIVFCGLPAAFRNRENFIRPHRPLIGRRRLVRSDVSYGLEPRILPNKVIRIWHDIIKPFDERLSTSHNQ